MGFIRRLSRLVWLSTRAPRLPALGLYEVCRSPRRVMLSDLDELRHMNNGAYLANLDHARQELVVRTGLWRRMRDAGMYPVVGAQTIAYRRSLTLGQRYVIDAFRGTGTLSTSSCSQTKPIEEAGSLLAYIDSLSRPSAGATVTGGVFAETQYSFEPIGRSRGLGGLTVTVDGPVSRSTMSAADGAFRFDGLPPGHYRIGVDAGHSPHWEARTARPFDLPNAHACHDAYVPLTLSATLEGTVVDAAGKPVSNASIALRRTDALTRPRNPDFPTFVGYARTRSDELGRYEFRGLQPGQYVVGLNIDSGPTDASPYAPVFLTGQDGQPEVVDFPLGGHRLLPQLVAVPISTIEVAGRVLWPDGRPGTGMRVRAFAQGETRFGMGRSVDAVVDDEGRFTLMLPAGIAHSVRAFVDPDRARAAQDYGVGAETEIVAGRGTVTLVLERRR